MKSIKMTESKYQIIDKILKLVEGYDMVTSHVTFKYKCLSDPFDIKSILPDKNPSVYRYCDAFYGFTGVKNITINGDTNINPEIFTESNPLNLLQMDNVLFELDNDDGIFGATEVFYSSDIRLNLAKQPIVFKSKTIFLLKLN